MKYLLSTALLVLILTHSIKAQKSTGFGDPDNIQPVLDYRLPDWGYSNFIFDFTAGRLSSDREFASIDESRKSTNFQLAPTYTIYRESEKRIFQFSSWMNTNYNGSRRDQKSSFSDDESYNKSLSIDFSFIPIIREYISSESFFYLRSPVQLDYSSSESQDKDSGIIQSERVEYNRTFAATPRFGLGFGRVRNVSPIIRALRLRERVNALNGVSRFSSQDVYSAADQFTRFEGYQQNYDRPGKYFWGDLDNGVSVDLRSLSTFDFLYLTDVLNEALGARREGWEVIGGLQFNYSKKLMKVKDKLNSFSQRNTDIDKRIGGFASGRWFKSTSLNQQWSLFANALAEYPVGKQEIIFQEKLKRNIQITAGISWLWTITDRILIQSTLSDTHSRNKIKLTAPSSGQKPEFTRWENQFSLDTNLNLFIENSLQLNVSIKPSLFHRKEIRDAGPPDLKIFDWRATAGLRYYFSRNLY